MEKENEIIENLFDENAEVTENNPEVTPVEEPKEVVEENTTEIEQIEENPVFVDLPPVAPVSYEEVETPEEISVEVKGEEQIEVPEEIRTEMENGVSEEQPVTGAKTEIDPESLNKEVLENPNAQIKLNTEKDEVVGKKEIEELKNVKLMDNSSLRFVLILGAILLVVIFLIPIVSEYI